MDEKSLAIINDVQFDSVEQQPLTDQTDELKVISRTFHVFNICEKFEKIWSMANWGVVDDPYDFRLLLIG